MSDFFVMLVFETVVDKSQLLDFKHFASPRSKIGVGIELEHSIQDSDFMDRH